MTNRPITADVGKLHPQPTVKSAWLWLFMAFAATAVMLALIAIYASRPRNTERSLQLCVSGPEQGCREVAASEIQPSPSEIFIRQQVIVHSAAPLAQPLTLWVMAMASSEVRWNGVLVGTNGRPARDAAHEVPGDYVKAFTIAPELIQPGRNLLAIRMSFQHLWLPTQRPVKMIGLKAWGATDFPDLRHYLLALLTFGVLVAGLLFFGFAAVMDRWVPPSRVLAAVAGLAAAQLALETSRVFLPYPYPWQLARVSGIVALSAAIGVLMTGYAALRFAPGLTKTAMITVGITAAAGALIIPAFDWKALFAIAVAMAAVTILSVRGICSSLRGASVSVGLCIAGLSLVLFQQYEFLDQGWYGLLAVSLAVLMMEQSLELKRSRSEARQLADRLCRLTQKNEPIILKDGPRTHRVHAHEIVSIKAADDYCEVRLANGRTLLISAALSRLLRVLPAPFIRIHRSHAVNRTHIATIVRTRNGRMARLTDGTTLSISRSYFAALGNQFTGSGLPNTSVLQPLDLR